jgi:gluconolactonase
VYRWNPDTGVIQAVADYTLRPNGGCILARDDPMPPLTPSGLTFSPDGKWLYVTDTGAAQGFTGVDWSAPASMVGWRVEGQPDATQLPPARQRRRNARP